MGCAASKHATARGADAGAGGTGTGTGAGGGDPQAATNNTFNLINNPLSVLNPAVAIENLWAKTQDIGKMGDHVLKEGAHHLKVIFAKPFDGDMSSYSPPSHYKTEEEKAFLEKALLQNFVFEDLTHRELLPLIKAFEKQQVAADTKIITEGEEGDYFYILESGAVEFSVKGKVVGEPATAGASFGELALLYSCPRAATVQAKEDTVLFRVDQKAFRFILQAQTKEGEVRKNKLLKDVKFLKGLNDMDLAKLAANMTPLAFHKGEVLGKKGDEVAFFWIVETGQLQASDIEVGGKKYEDFVIGPGGYFGQYAIVSEQPRLGNLVAIEDGMAFRIAKDTFKQVIGDLDHALMRSVDKIALSAIKCIQDTRLDAATLRSVAGFVEDKNYKAGDVIMTERLKTPASLYLIRQGRVKLVSRARNETLGALGYFGEETMLHDAQTGKNGPSDTTEIDAPYSVEVLEDCRLGVLTLENCRKVFDTIYMGKGEPGVADSIVDRQITLKELAKHRILGAGTFGQVWLVSRINSDGDEKVYALKIQSKYELCENGQAKAVVHEKNIMAQLRHPFISDLAGAFQDDNFVYMLMGLVQGGELYSVMHTKTRDKLPEDETVFYVAGIQEGLSYMHRRGFVYRDLKPENVLIRSEGYPVIVDFGFAKYVSDKTYTLCGTPLYLPPEVILNRGHDWGADHWSLGVLTFEMLSGYTPFYEEGMDQMSLFKAIVKGTFHIPTGFSSNANHFLSSMIKRDPTRRLGSLAGGERDIFIHPFFESIDFKELRRMAIKPPYVPTIKNPLDATNFEDWSHLQDKTEKKYKSLTKKQEEIFDDF